MAERIIKICDQCGSDLAEGTGARLKLTYVKEAQGVKHADLCDRCAAQIPGRQATRRRNKRRSVGE